MDAFKLILGGREEESEKESEEKLSKEDLKDLQRESFNDVVEAIKNSNNNLGMRALEAFIHFTTQLYDMEDKEDEKE